MFKGVIKNLESNGSKVTVIARAKDVLLELLRAENIEYTILGPYRDGLIGKLFITPLLLFNYFFVLIRSKPSILISKASPYASVFTKLFGFKHIIFPDSDGFTSNDILVRFAGMIVTPDNYRIDYGKKHNRVNGFFENMYLHPDQFKPDQTILDKYSIDSNRKYSIVRFVGWGAHHDGGLGGFSKEEKLKLLESLNKYGNVFITSERALDKELEPYRLRIDPVDIHHILYFSSLYVGDSQSMATEASLLGVPSIRMNSFVGESDMTNFKLLEEEYKLLFNFSDSKTAIHKAEELLLDDTAKEVWQNRRKLYYENNRDVFTQVMNLLNQQF
jgi:predicted glycosyltransferase